MHPPDFWQSVVLVDMRKITIFHELCLDLWLCIGVFGPMNLYWLPWDAGLVGNLVICKTPVSETVWPSED